MSTEGSESPEIAITFVHGTFARGAGWAQPDSPFAQNLAQKIGYKTRFFTFNWSGENSHGARLLAGLSLAQHARKIRKCFPNVLHYIVAHSHGGNVACYSLRYNKSDREIAGIVTLGTPFIACSERSIFGDSDPIRMFIADLLALIFMIFLFALSVPTYIALEPYAGLLSLVDDLWLFLIMAPLEISLFVLPILPFYYSPLIVLKLEKSLKRRQEVVVKRFKFPNMRTTKILSFHALRDEASTFLSVIRSIADFPRLCIGFIRPIITGWDKISGASDTINGYRKSLLALSRAERKEYDYGVWDGLNNAWWRVLGYAICLGCLFFTILLVIFTLDGTNLLVNLFAVLAFIPAFFAVCSLVCALAVIGGVVLPPLARAHRFGFGGEHILDNWLANIHAVSDPKIAFPHEVANCSYKTVRFQRLEADSSLAWRHRRLLYDDEVIRQIADWINVQSAGLGVARTYHSVGRWSFGYPDTRRGNSTSNYWSG